MDEVLTVSELSAGYRGRIVVRGIDLSLRRGDILGLLGANGSGKSTLIRAITGQIPLTGGSVAIDGIDLTAVPERAKAGFGLAIEPHELPAPLSGRQYIELVASIRGCAPNDLPSGDLPSADLLERLELGRWIDRPIAEYSLGTQAKAAIVAALLGQPPLLIFDETLNGLDPVAAWEVKRVITALCASGRHAVIVSTHVVEAVPALCNRAVLMADGRLSRRWDAAELAEAGRAPGAFEESVMQALRMRTAA